MFHHHSTYSQLDSINKIPVMVAKAIEQGYPAVGLSDHGTTSGLYEFHKECRKQGIKSVLGCELYFTPNVNIKDRSLHYHLCVFAKNKVGYHNMLNLVTESHKNFYYSPRVDYNRLLSMNTEGLIFTTACCGGILRDGMEIFNRLSEHLDIYAEVHTYDGPEQREYNEMVVRNIKQDRIIFATDSHYTTKEESVVRNKWMQLSKKNDYFQDSTLYLMSFAEVRKQLECIPTIDQIIQNTIALSSEIEEYEIIPEGKAFPIFPIDNQREFLMSFCLQHASNDEEVERLSYEMDVLEKTDYINYMLILKDIFDFCKKSHIRTGVGRGSVVASLTAFLAGITKINPLHYDLVFERFAHPERVSLPDK